MASSGSCITPCRVSPEKPAKSIDTFGCSNACSTCGRSPIARVVRSRTKTPLQHADRPTAGAAWLDTGLVCATHMGGPLEPRNVNRSWYAVRTRAGLDSVRLHDLRHSCASFLLAAGASPRTVMKTLGHSQIGLTMNTYTHVLPEIERAAIDAAAKAIFE